MEEDIFYFFILAGLQNNCGVQHLACHIDNQNVPKLATKLNLYSPHWDRSILCKQNVFRGFTMRQKSFLIFQLFLRPDPRAIGYINLFLTY